MVVGNIPSHSFKIIKYDIHISIAIFRCVRLLRFSHPTPIWKTVHVLNLLLLIFLISSSFRSLEFVVSAHIENIVLSIVIGQYGYM